MNPLRIAMTLPGEASLGTFEAGAVSALVVGVQAINRASTGGAVRVDLLTGASSGSLTAVLAARALLAGEDPVDPLRRAWVTEPTLDALLGNDARAPLTLDRARQVAGELLTQPFASDEDAIARAQATPVLLEFALTCLRGFLYRIPLGSDEGVEATSYVDWARIQVRRRDADGFHGRWPAAVEAAIASASHPVAFPPTSLDRKGSRYAYQHAHVRNFPDASEPGAEELWYADGGLVDRQPLGRCVARARVLDRRDARRSPRRLILLVRPESEQAPASDDHAWTEAAPAPTWRETLSRSLRIVAAHNLYEDLRAVRKTNTRLAMAELLEKQLVALLVKVEPQDRVAFFDAATEIEALRTPWRKGKTRPGPPDARREDIAQPGADELIRDVVRHALGVVTGLENKATITVEPISAPPALIAGGALHQFGGFLAESLRANDFLVGYETMRDWMEGNLAGHVASADADTACDAVAARAASIPGWVGGVTTRRRPSLRAQVDVARAGLRTAWIGLRDQVRSGAGDKSS